MFSCGGLTKWKDQEEPYKFELSLPGKKKVPGWVRAMAEPEQSQDSETSSSASDTSSDSEGSDHDGAQSILNLLQPKDASSHVLAMLGGGSPAPAPAPPQPTAQPVDAEQARADDRLLRSWLREGGGIAFLADAVGQALHGGDGLSETDAINSMLEVEV